MHIHSEKISKQPVFWIAIVAIIAGIVFATISARQMPEHNYLVTEFCEELQSINSYEEADIEDFVSLSKYYNLHSPEIFVNEFEDLWNPGTQDLKYSIGEECVLSDGKILVPVIMSVYRGSAHIEDFICSVYLKEADGEMSIYSWNIGPHQENYREKVDRDVIKYYESDPHDQDRAFYDFKQLEISTLIHQDGTYDREIRMVMSSEGWGEKQAEVSAFLETIVPEGATYFLDATDGGEIWFEVIQTGMTTEELNIFNQQYFGSGECYFTMRESSGEESLLELHRDCVENIDFYYFYNPNSRTYPTVTYTIMGEDNYVTAANHTTNVGTWKIDLCESKTFEQNYVRIFTPLEMDIHTEVLEENRFCRTMKITLDAAPDQSEMEKIQHDIDICVARAEENFDTVAEVKISSETIDGKNIFTLIQSGTAEQMSVTDYMLYRERTYSVTTLRYEVLNPRIYVGAYENINYYQLFGRCESSTQYTMSFTEGTKMKYYDSRCNLNRRTYKPCAYEIKGTDVTVNITEPDAIMLVQGIRLNWWALGFWAMMSVAVVCFVLSFVNRSMLAEVKKRLTSRHRAAQEAGCAEEMWLYKQPQEEFETKVPPVPRSEPTEDIVIKDDKLQELDVEIKF